MRAQFVASEILIGVRRNITMILSVVLAVAVSLFLVGFALLVRDQVDRAKGYWYDKVQVSVFLCGGGNVGTPKCPQAATDGQIAAVHDTLAALPQVDKVLFESSQQAAVRAKDCSRAAPSCSPRRLLPDLPPSWRVKLKDPTQTGVVVSAPSRRCPASTRRSTSGRRSRSSSR